MSWVKLIVAIIWIFLHKTYFFEFLGGNMYFMFILEVGKEHLSVPMYIILFFTLVKIITHYLTPFYDTSLLYFYFVLLALPHSLRRSEKGKLIDNRKKKKRENNVWVIHVANSGSSQCSFFLFLLAMAQQHQKTFFGNLMHCKCLSLIFTGQNKNLPIT